MVEVVVEDEAESTAADSSLHSAHLMKQEVAWRI